MAEKKASGRLRTPEEIKKELARRGETIADLDGTVGDESCGGKRTKRKEAAA